MQIDKLQEQEKRQKEALLNKIKSVMHEKNITYRQMAKDLNIKHNTIHNYLSGTRPIKLSTFLIMAKYLGIDFDKYIREE